MISPFKLANAPENVALRALGIHAAELDALARARKIRVFRGRGGARRYDVQAYLDAQARVLGPRRDRWAKARRCSASIPETFWPRPDIARARTTI